MNESNKISSTITGMLLEPYSDKYLKLTLLGEALVERLYK